MQTASVRPIYGEKIFLKMLCITPGLLNKMPIANLGR